MQRRVPEGVEVVRNVRVLVIYYVDIRRMIVRSRSTMQLVLSSKNPGRQFLLFSHARNVQQFVNRGTLSDLGLEFFVIWNIQSIFVID